MNSMNLEEKDVYKLFNDIKFDEAELTTEDTEEVSTIQKERIKKNLKQKTKNKNNFKKVKYGAAAAGVCLVCLVGASFKYPTFAKDIPILNSIIEMLHANHGDYGKYSDYSSVINKSVTSNGVTITINEALADDSRIILSYTIKSDKKLNDLEVFCPSLFLKVNGNHLSGGGSATGKYIDDTTYVGSEEIKSDAIKELPDKLNIDLNIEYIHELKGKWDFAFSLSKNKSLNESAVITPNVKLDLKDRYLTIDKITASKLETSILTKGKLKSGVDANNPLLPNDDFIVFDDRGVELIWKGGTTNKIEPNTNEFTDELNFVTSKHKSKYLTVIPYTVTPSKVGSSDSSGKVTSIEGIVPKEINKDINSTYPMELTQGNMGKLIINEVKKEGDKTIVKYRAEGIAPLFQAQNLHILDSDGNYVKPIDYDIRKDETKPNDFTFTLEPLDPNKKYVLSTNTFDNIDLREDLKFKINLED